MSEGRLAGLDAEPIANSRTRDRTRRPLKKRVNRLEEEIARFESHSPARSDGT
jgi:hypothetical protein